MAPEISDYFDLALFLEGVYGIILLIVSAEGTTPISSLYTLCLFSNSPKRGLSNLFEAVDYLYFFATLGAGTFFGLGSFRIGLLFSDIFGNLYP